MMRLKQLFWCLPLLCLLFIACSDNQEEKEVAGERPFNVILVVADDHGYADIGYLDRAPDVVTPNLDRLAQEGIYFSQAYASSPICSPSRMSLITGVYHQRFGTYWYGGKGIHLTDYPTLAEQFRAQGYATGYIGKVHYGSQDSDTTNRNFPTNHGFDWFFGHTSARKHYLIHDDQYEEAFLASKAKHDQPGQSLRQGALWRNKQRIDTLDFSTRMFGEAAVDYIRQHREQPFFLQVSFNAVHNFTHQLPKEYLQAQGLEGYRDWDPAEEAYYDWYQEGRYPNNPEGRVHYLGQLHFLDQEIGRLLDALEHSKLRERTLIVYVGDNGGSTPIYANNSPLRGSKYLLYEGGIRVPMIFSQPGRVQKNVQYHPVTSTLDIYPTLCEWTGVAMPDKLDGHSLAPVLLGADTTIYHASLFWETSHERAIRKGSWKWHEATNDQHARYEMVDLELGQFLTNLDEDVSESINLSTSKPALQDELISDLERWSEQIRSEAENSIKDD